VLHLLDALRFNRGLIKDPVEYFRESGCVSWLCLTGSEFAEMADGVSFAQVQQVTRHSRNVVSDPPRVLDLELAKAHVRALDELPGPTLISCRTGPRASAVAYMYAGLKANADGDEVVAAGVRDGAPFVDFEEYKAWVQSSIEALKAEAR